MRKYKGKVKRKHNKLVIILVICIALGIGAGVVLAGYYGNESTVYAGSVNFAEKPKAEIFINSIIKHGKYIIGIWFLAFMPIGFVFTFIIVFYKGLSFGYTMAVLADALGGRGVIYGLCLCILQHLILFPVLVIMGYYCIRTAVLKNAVNMPEYLPVLGLGITATAVIGLIETYAVPFLYGIMTV